MNRLTTRIKLGTLLVILSAVLSGCFAVGGHPSAGTLLNNFHTHRTDFERLLQMFMEDTQVVCVL